MIDTVTLIANGEVYNHSICKGSYIVAVDGGLLHCDRWAIRPHLLLGDFDSASKELLNKYADVEKITHPRDKDCTDLELALQLPQVQQAEICYIYGGSGGDRSDHFLGNLFLLLRHPKAVLETATERISCIQNRYEGRCFPGQRISFFALGEKVCGVNSKGLKWELTQAVLGPNFFSISNECIGETFSIQITEGQLILVQERSFLPDPTNVGMSFY